MLRILILIAILLDIGCRSPVSDPGGKPTFSVDLTAGPYGPYADSSSLMVAVCTDFSPRLPEVHLMVNGREPDTTYWWMPYCAIAAPGLRGTYWALSGEDMLSVSVNSGAWHAEGWIKIPARTVFTDTTKQSWRTRDTVHWSANADWYSITCFSRTLGRVIYRGASVHPFLPLERIEFDSSEQQISIELSACNGHVEGEDVNMKGSAQGFLRAWDCMSNFEITVRDDRP